MNKIVSRVLVVIAALAAVMSMFAMADAQLYEAANPECGRGSCVEVDPATANNGVFGFEDINPTADAAAIAAGAGADGGATGGTGGGIAITGAETDIPLAIGIGLLALGGTAVVASRKGDE